MRNFITVLIAVLLLTLIGCSKNNPLVPEPDYVSVKVGYTYYPTPSYYSTITVMNDSQQVAVVQLSELRTLKIQKGSELTAIYTINKDGMAELKTAQCIIQDTLTWLLR